MEMAIIGHIVAALFQIRLNPEGRTCKNLRSRFFAVKMLFLLLLGTQPTETSRRTGQLNGNGNYWSYCGSIVPD